MLLRLGDRAQMRSTVKLLACFVLMAGVAGAKAEREPRLDCSTGKIGPVLDYEFRFIAGLWYSLPAKQFWGERFRLEIGIRVTPINGTPGEPKVIRNQLAARQEVPEGTRGRFDFSAVVSLGPGDYQYYWRISDGRGRACEGSRVVKASLGRDQRNIEVTLAPGEILDTAMHLLRPQRPVERPHLQSSRRMKIFISMDVLGRRGRLVRTRPHHVLPHFAALRKLANSPNFNEFSVVAFSFEDQKVLAQQDYQETVDFPSMRGVLTDLRPQTVDISELGKGSEMQFFESLLAEELLRTGPPEAVVFLGQDVHFGRKLQTPILASLRKTGALVSFLDASRYSWRGAIGNVVRAMGGKEYPMRRPTDLAKAMSSFEQRVLRTRPQ